MCNVDCSKNKARIRPHTGASFLYSLFPSFSEKKMSHLSVRNNDCFFIAFWIFLPLMKGRWGYLTYKNTSLITSMATVGAHWYLALVTTWPPFKCFVRPLSRTSQSVPIFGHTDSPCHDAGMNTSKTNFDILILSGSLGIFLIQPKYHIFVKLA